MDKIIKIGGIDVGMRVTALTPRLYRHKTGRDMFHDMTHLAQELQYAGNDSAQKQFEVIDLEMFENVAYIMAKQYDASIPSTAEEWLDNFEMFSIYDILPAIMGLWYDNLHTTANAKKK